MNPFAKTSIIESVMGRFQNGSSRMQEAVDRITAHSKFQPNHFEGRAVTVTSRRWQLWFEKG
jgi:hypothetical protein